MTEMTEKREIQKKEWGKQEMGISTLTQLMTVTVQVLRKAVFRIRFASEFSWVSGSGLSKIPGSGISEYGSETLEDEF
jgi:hypothetical protein